MNNEKLQWHPAFAAALRITFQDEMKYLELQEEYLLSKKPPQIDVLILKKVKEISLKKKIGQIFRDIILLSINLRMIRSVSMSFIKYMVILAFINRIQTKSKRLIRRY